MMKGRARGQHVAKAFLAVRLASAGLLGSWDGMLPRQEAHPSFFGQLSPEQSRIEERIRTLSLCICAMGVVASALYYLRSVLIPLVLALALKYLLQPLIESLTVRPLRCCGCTFCAETNHKDAPRVSSWKRPLWELFCQFKLPHWLAVLVALTVAFSSLAVIGLVVTDSVRVFTARADTYRSENMSRACA